MMIGPRYTDPVLTLFTCLAPGAPLKHSWTQPCPCRRQRTSVGLTGNADRSSTRKDRLMECLPMVLGAAERRLTFPGREDGLLYLENEAYRM